MLPPRVKSCLAPGPKPMENGKSECLLEDMLISRILFTSYLTRAGTAHLSFLRTIAKPIACQDFCAMTRPVFTCLYDTTLFVVGILFVSKWPVFVMTIPCHCLRCSLHLKARYATFQVWILSLCPKLQFLHHFHAAQTSLVILQIHRFTNVQQGKAKSNGL